MRAGPRGGLLLWAPRRRKPDYPWLRLRYCVNGERVDCIVRLVSTRPNYGGHRWWFVCPLMGRRAAKLYLPPGGASCSGAARPTG